MGRLQLDRRLNLRRLAVVAVPLIVLTSGCDSSPGSTEGTPSGARTTTPHVLEPSSASAPVAIPYLQQLPVDWQSLPWQDAGRPLRAPKAQAVLDDVLDGPGPPARLAYHPLERMTDPEGWESEAILFLGSDGQWRRLEMADLGLPEAWWPGPDTYGSGSLSADGRTWAAHTNAGVVFVDLTTGKYRHVLLPRTSPMVRYLSWIPGHHAVSAYARKPAGYRYTTFRVAPDGRVTPVDYEGNRTRFDVDGTPVEITTSGRTLTMTQVRPTGAHVIRWSLPVPFLRATEWGVFSRDDVAIVQPSRSMAGPVTIWVFDKFTGQPFARLAVPQTTTIQRWQPDGGLVLLIDNHRLVAWHPSTGRFRRLLELPPPYPKPGEWAASTVALAGA